MKQTDTIQNGGIWGKGVVLMRFVYSLLFELTRDMLYNPNHRNFLWALYVGIKAESNLEPEHCQFQPNNYVSDIH